MVCMMYKDSIIENSDSHMKVAAGRFSVSHQMASIFLSDNTGLFAFFA